MPQSIKEKRNYFFAALSCFAVMIALNTDLGAISAEAAQGGLWNLLAGNIKKLEYLLPTFTYRDAIFALLIFYFMVKSDVGWKCPLSKWSFRIPAGLTAFFLVFGYSFRYTNTWDLIFMDTFHLMVSALMMVGFYLLFARIFCLLLNSLFAYAAKISSAPGRLSGRIFEKHAFAGPFLVILLFWTPYIVAKFPGAAMPETLAEMRQFYWNSLNNYYPPFHTVTLSLIMQLGNLLHSYTLGFFLNLLLQLGLLISAFSYGFTLMKRWQTPYIFRYLALAVICVVEYFPMEATTVEKDIPYAACVIFLVLLLFELVRDMENGQPYPIRQTAGLILASLGVAVHRNEGFYLIFFSGIALSVCAGKLLWKSNRKKCVRILTAALLPIFLFAAYQKILLPLCGVEDNGPKEALSIPFQQTARYVRDYGYELTEEEEAVIAAVLDYENLAELYDPITSDPVKYTYHAESSSDLAAYFRLWFQQLLKHPGNAVEATMNNAYGWFYQEGYAQNYLMTSRIEGQDVRWEINQPEKLSGIRQVMERVAKLLSRVPIVNWFENAGFVSWMTILLTAVWIGCRRKRFLITAAPLLTALLVCVAAPTFNYQMRYIMPVMFCVPFYIPMLLASLQKTCGAGSCASDKMLSRD